MLKVCRYVVIAFVALAMSASVSAVSIDLSGADFSFGEPIASLVGCMGSNCFAQTTDPIVRTTRIEEVPINETHISVQVSVLLETDYTGIYRNVPVDVTVPEVPDLNAGGTIPFEVTHNPAAGTHTFHVVVPELDGERELRMSVTKRIAQDTTSDLPLYQRLSSLAGRFASIF